MSRCFPYTPLRREEPLIESIKKGKEKDKKKDKEERRKDKKENKEYNNNDPKNDQHKKHRHKKRKHKEISLLQHKDNCSTRVVNDLEKSGLTEEHGMPVQNPESSEVSHDSSTRRKIATVNNSTNGTVFRIKLSVLRQVNQDAPLLPRVEFQQKSGPSVGILKHEMQERCTTSDQACFSGRMVETNHEKEKHRSSRHSMPEGKKRSRDLKPFNKLVENWDAPKLQLESTESGCQDWLFASRNQRSEPCASKLIRVEDDSSHFSSSASSYFAPRAYYVPELEMYQLPYVIPF